MYLEYEYLNTFLKRATFARGKRKKIHMENSKRIDDAQLFTEKSLKPVLWQLVSCFAARPAEISEISQGPSPSHPE